MKAYDKIQSCQLDPDLGAFGAPVLGFPSVKRDRVAPTGCKMFVKRVVGVWAALAVCAGCHLAAGARTDGLKNVLLIVVDDLRPQLGSYGLGFMQTPNMDALAAQGTLFERAYVQQSICSPSRNSFLSGRYE